MSVLECQLNVNPVWLCSKYESKIMNHRLWIKECE